MQNYRPPGPRQQTSLRIHKLIQSNLKAGAVVLLDICTEAQLETTAGSKMAELSSKTVRLFAENAALLTETDTEWEILNKAD